MARPAPVADPGEIDGEVLERNDRHFAWLVDRCRGLARAARRRRMRREAHVVLTFDEAGRVNLRFRPEETPDS
jgi:hypothetical protein